MNDTLQTVRKPFGAFVLLLSGTLLTLAAQNLPARLLAIPGDALRDKILNSGKFSDADYDDFTAARGRATAWHPQAEYFDELAAAYTARAARDNVTDADAVRYYRRGIDAQERALRLEPSDAYGWAQLAFLNIQTSDDPERALPFLRMSIETAPFEPNLMPSRLDMMVGLHDSLDADEQDQIPKVARAAWDADSYNTVMSAYKHNYLDIVETALRKDDAEHTRYERLLKDSKITVTPDAPADDASDGDAPEPNPNMLPAPDPDAEAPPAISYTP